MDIKPKSVLFVCTGNAGRSQMAAAMFAGIADGVDVYSAGVEPWSAPHPMAIKLMKEHGLDISNNRPTHVKNFIDKHLDFVVTIGDQARNETPDFSSCAARIYWDIDDPADADDTAESEGVFRNTLNAISDRLHDLGESLRIQVSGCDVAWKPGLCTSITSKSGVDGPNFIPEQHLPLFVKAGFSVIELGAYRQENFFWEDPSSVKNLQKVANNEGVHVWSIHPPDRGNLCSTNSGERGKQIEVLKRFVDIADELGSAALSFHAGHGIKDIDKDVAIANLQASLSILADYVCDKPVSLCLETLMGPPNSLSNKELLDILNSTHPDCFSLVFDTGHPHISGELLGTAQQAGRRLKTLHLHDNDGKDDQHLLPGMGIIPWPTVMREIYETGYCGPLMIELGAQDSTCDFSTHLLRAKESVDFLLNLIGN